MKSLLLFITIFTISLMASNNKDNTQKNIDKQIKKEQKYAKEQTFYSGKNYDLESAQIDEKSLDSIPEQPDYNDDFNMDSVYD